MGYVESARNMLAGARHLGSLRTSREHLSRWNQITKGRGKRHALLGVAARFESAGAIVSAYGSVGGMVCSRA